LNTSTLRVDLALLKHVTFVSNVSKVVLGGVIVIVLAVGTKVRKILEWEPEGTRRREDPKRDG
jgi:hypothetical protein